jgi:hypothetical protein
MLLHCPAAFVCRVCTLCNRAIAAQHKALVQEAQALTDDEFWASAAVQRAAGVSVAPTSTARSSKRGLANRLVDLARQVSPNSAACTS